MTDAIEHTRLWVERAVIGLNLCPFAKAPQRKGLVRYVCTQTRQVKKLLDVLSQQLLYLESTSPDICETILLIHPNVLTDFLDYNDFLDKADSLLERLGLDDVFQIASFHPDYQFANTDPQDMSNYTNRSPYPMLHLLRESSLDTALQSHPDAQALADEIVLRNQELLQKMGKSGWEALWQ